MNGAFRSGLHVMGWVDVIAKPAEWTGPLFACSRKYLSCFMTSRIYLANKDNVRCQGEECVASNACMDRLPARATGLGWLRLFLATLGMA